MGFRSALAAAAVVAVVTTAVRGQDRALDTPTILPDGRGLPAGQGTARAGRDVFAARCASCHGSEGRGAEAPPLAGGRGSLATPQPLQTVGSFWPYATTVWDYVNRAMPANRPGVLTSDEVYAVTAYLLWLNGIIADTDVMSAATLPRVTMPNRDGFVPDPRDTRQR